MGESWRWAAGSFMAGLTPATRTALLALGTRRSFPRGRQLLREGERTDHVEVLLHGIVKVSVIADGIDVLLSIRSAGDVIGEMASLTGRSRTATVTTCGEVVASSITHVNFNRFLGRHPDAALRMAAVMSERLEWANARRTDFAAYPAEVRLGRVLASLAGSCGRATSGGTLIDVPLSQRELATMVGIAQPTMQKAIRELRERRLISTGYRQITVVDLPGLAALGPD
ncbi:CRP-like cAMP-binding protein [Allocatelliglobosispora scoriae]|uniref:CRP-like cAMP-binding protein n=1 Tax=Allocatelliglobosispora scoriae TaxID=643052 RepID=A0A841BTH5_9ACTN|nr:Crp/Fnr family transcriptional regulator [Allocatelliglobosispora scoriae]MBB5870091.1 CRP-like cAMP-binding protein [Allocatelliglobosispora scoriae]